MKKVGKLISVVELFIWKSRVHTYVPVAYPWKSCSYHIILPTHFAVFEEIILWFSLCNALWLTLIEEGHGDSKFMFWMDFELGQFSEGLKHKTNRKKIIFGFSAQKKKSFRLALNLKSLTSSMTESSIKRGASFDKMPWVAKT